MKEEHDEEHDEEQEVSKGSRLKDLREVTDTTEEDAKEVPDGTGEAPHPMGPHGDPTYRDDDPLVGDPVLVDTEVMDERD